MIGNQYKDLNGTTRTINPLPIYARQLVAMIVFGLPALYKSHCPGRGTLSRFTLPH